jgi:hypothetical protein
MKKGMLTLVFIPLSIMCMEGLEQNPRQTGFCIINKALLDGDTSNQSKTLIIQKALIQGNRRPVEEILNSLDFITEDAQKKDFFKEIDFAEIDKTANMLLRKEKTAVMQQQGVNAGKKLLSSMALRAGGVGGGLAMSFAGAASENVPVFAMGTLLFGIGLGSGTERVFTGAFDVNVRTETEEVNDVIKKLEKAKESLTDPADSLLTPIGDLEVITG